MVTRRGASVRFEGAFPSKGYEAFHELDNTVAIDVLVGAEGEVTSFTNLSKVHPRLSLDTRPELSHARAKAGFSERKPYPGCTASQPVVSAAATTFGIRR